jgi:HlyD family secretion protein
MSDGIINRSNHTEEINDIIGRTPSGILFRANIVIIGIILLLLIGAWFISYPDVISAPLTISSYDPPVKLLAQANGRISKLYSADADSVPAGATIAVIDNGALPGDVFNLKNITGVIDTTAYLEKIIFDHPLPVNCQLGEMQSEYAAFYDLVNNYKLLFGKTDSKFIKSSLHFNQINKGCYNKICLAIITMAKKIKGHIDEWEKQYVIKTPVAGKLVFVNTRRENQYVNFGDTVFIILPFSSDYELRAKIPLYRVSKVKINQPVLVKLQEYPYGEYGMLHAKITMISNVAVDSAYSAHLALTNGLKTTNNIQIELKPENSGFADIIIDNKNLLERLFEKIYKR